MLLKLFYKNVCVTVFSEILCVYNSTKDELLLKYFRRKYLYLLMASFGISKQLVWSLKHYSDKQFSLVETTLRYVRF